MQHVYPGKVQHFLLNIFTFILALSSSFALNASNAACKVSDVTPWSKPPTKTLQLVGEATSIFHKAMSFSFDK